MSHIECQDVAGLSQIVVLSVVCFLTYTQATALQVFADKPSNPCWPIYSKADMSLERENAVEFLVLRLSAASRHCCPKFFYQVKSSAH